MKNENDNNNTQPKRGITAYAWLTDEQAAFLSLSNEDRRKVPNKKAILESLHLFDPEDIED